MKTLALLLVLCVSVVSLSEENRLVVHEWGTFTSLQDEAGNAIGGINTDDEPVPAFVHNIARGLLLSQSELPPIFFQGTPQCHPGVTMRLETPVLYFHASHEFRGRVDVCVEFTGGWLTQYYPDALAVAPGADGYKFGELTAGTTGSLTWHNLEINAANSGPETGDHVWTAPRAVQALQVKTEKGESEKYLFYRGVGHLEAPLIVTRRENTLQIAANAANTPAIPMLWYADIRKDGTAAYRTIRGAENAAVLAETPARFAETDYKQTSIAALRGDMCASLLSAGLNGDEADALLNTWELSYFKSAGARLFFLVPQEWKKASCR